MFQKYFVEYRYDCSGCDFVEVTFMDANESSKQGIVRCSLRKDLLQKYASCDKDEEREVGKEGKVLHCKILLIKQRDKQ